MPFLPPFLLRFLKSLRRFTPFLMVWALILLIPASREPLQLQLLGSSLAPNYNPPWRQNLNPAREFDAFARAEANPRDFEAQLWRFSRLKQGFAPGFSEDGEPNTKVYSQRDLVREAEALREEFPGQKWLGALVLREQLAPPPGPRRDLSISKAQQQVALVRLAARLEPGNAYYPLLEASLWRRSREFDAMWRALDRAARGQTFDTHVLEWARALVRAHEGVRPLLLEEREALWRDKRDSNLDLETLRIWPPFLTHEARLAQQRGDHRRAIEIAVMLGNIGDLMQRAPNTPAIASSGHDWKSQVWTLVFRSYPPKPRVKASMWARTLGAYGAAHGRLDLAPLERRWQTRQSRIYEMAIYAPGAGYGMPPKTHKDALWHAASWRAAGGFVGLHLLFVSVVWTFVNLILWRGAGTPSSRRERVLPALFMAALGLALALWSWKQWQILDASPMRRWNPARDRLMMAVGSVGVLAFFGAPFLLAVWSAGATMWKHKVEFLKPARIETELQLSPRQATILKSGPAIVCTFSLLATLGFWLLYLILVAFDVGNFDPLAWLPDDGRIGIWSLAMPTEALWAPIIYCLLLNFVGFLLWFNKWRYYAGKESRALTHRGLRGWKEALGIYIVFGSAIYFGTALCGWPARADAARELEIRMTRGELAP